MTVVDTLARSLVAAVVEDCHRCNCLLEYPTKAYPMIFALASNLRDRRHSHRPLDRRVEANCFLVGARTVLMPTLRPPATRHAAVSAPPGSPRNPPFLAYAMTRRDTPNPGELEITSRWTNEQDLTRR